MEFLPLTPGTVCLCTRCMTPLGTIIAADRGMCGRCWTTLRGDMSTLYAGAGALAHPTSGPEFLFSRVRVDGVEYATTNVPWRHVSHSPSGIEWGYSGSGPADLALNLLSFMRPVTAADIVTVRGPRESVDVVIDTPPLWELHDGTHVLRDVYRVHQTFKQEFITPLDRMRGSIRADAIRAFLANRGITASR
jgi:hypothetical protein